MKSGKVKGFEYSWFLNVWYNVSALTESQTFFVMNGDDWEELLPCMFFATIFETMRPKGVSFTVLISINGSIVVPEFIEAGKVLGN